MKIETVSKANLKSVLPLISAYQKFYNQVPSKKRNEAHFSSYTRNHSQGILFAAFDGKKAVGFCTLYFLPSSLSGNKMCVLNDLYTVPSIRKRGVARALIEHGRTYARDRGFETMEWWTQQTNKTAQRLYDQLGAQRSSWFLYELPTGDRS